MVAETREVDQFTVEISFAPDDTQLDLLFDTEEDYYPELIENLESGFWQHMICKVAAYYDGTEMGTAYLGSIVAESPDKWIESDKDYVNDLVDQAVDEARGEAVRMLDRLKADFLS
jgi:hypothetical protein